MISYLLFPYFYYVRKIVGGWVQQILIIAYSRVPNRGRVWNNHIGWTFNLKIINVGYGINVLGGNFSKIMIL